MTRLTEASRASPTRRSLAAFNRYLLFRSVFDTICGGTTFIFVAFALVVGVEGEKMARLTLAASVGCMLQMVMLPFVTRVAARKRFILVAGLIEPVIIVAAVLSVPLLPQGWRLPVLVGAVFLAAAFLHMTRPMMDDWVASTIPGAIRGRYLGLRVRLVAVTMIVTLLLAGALGDASVRLGAMGLAALLSAGCVFAVLAIIALSHAHMPTDAPQAAVRARDFHQVLALRPFRSYLLALFLFNGPFLLAVPFYQVLNLDVLKMTRFQVALVIIGYQVMKLVTAPLAGRWIERVGPRRSLLVSMPGYVLFFALLALAGDSRPWIVALAWAMIGALDGIYAVAIQVALYAVVPAKGARPAFFAVSNLISLGLFGVGALIAEPLVRGLDRFAPVTFGPFTLGHYHLLFALCAVLMLPALAGSLFIVAGRRGGAWDGRR